jgi:HlyD family secretion protein
MKPSRRIRWIIGLTALTALAAAVVMRPDVVAVDVVSVERGPLAVTIDEDGITRIRNHAEIAAPVTGRLLASTLRAGDAVTRGQVVARIAPAPLDERSRRQAEAALAAAQAVRAQAEARVRQAEVMLTEARRNRSRAERLGDAGALSARSVESAQSEERVRERELEAARAGADAAMQGESQASLTLLGAGSSGAAGVVSVRAPIGGRVLRLVEEHERVVPAGSPLMEVGEGELEIVVDVLSSDAARVRVGSRMKVNVPGAAGFTAVVSRVEPSAFTKVSPLGVEEQRVNVIAALDTAPVGLGDRFRVATSIVLWSAESALTVPSTSLVPTDEGWGVYVVERGRARLRMVSLGQTGVRAVEVLSGINVGEVVISHPDERIKEGVRVASAER